MKSDRPTTMKSGVALQSTYSVQHRSDILMEEQVEAVKKSQEELKLALSDLEAAKTEDDLTKCRAAVQDAREISEKAIMVLQVLTKVNTELSFARADLDEALEKQEGDINEARKRVMWLEDRMGLLCGKARLRGQAFQKPKKSHRSPETSLFRSRLSSTSEKSSEDEFDPRDPRAMGRGQSIGFKSDATRRPADFSPTDSGSSYPPYGGQQSRPDMADTPSSGADYYMLAKQQSGRGLEDSDSEDDDGMPPTLDVPPGLAGMQGMVAMGTSQAGAKVHSDEEEEEDSQEGYGPAPTDYTGSQAPDSQRYQVEEDQEEGESEDEEGETTARATPDEEDQSDTEQPQIAQPQKPLGIVHIGAQPQEEEEESGSEGEEEEGSEGTEGSQSARSSETGTGTTVSQAQGDKAPTFMTEVSMAKSVTIQAPTKPAHRQETDLSELSDRELTQEELTQLGEDHARDYWHSEHHRFEYSEYSEVLCDLDPLSYHSVGLAVPGSFIDKRDRTFSDLPWRSRRKGSDINDIHRIALDKLASRVHTMYDKLYDAAQLSVRPINNEGKRETTMFSSFDATREGARSGTPTDSRPGMVTAPPTTAEGHSRPQTVSTAIVPIKIGLNVYHPKPIPPPEMLPLTRTNQDKVYPRLSNQFIEANDILSHKPAVRIADQRNLYKETKLKLYRERPKRENKDTSSMEKKFRMMLEQEKSFGSRSSRSSRVTTDKGTAAGTRMSITRTLTKASTWSRLKPSSRGKEYGGLKWERVKTIVHTNLVSRQPEERRDAAKHLGLLRCGDAMVFYALKDRLRVDDDARTRYEAAKSLVLLGCWDEDVLQVILKYLVLGNTEVRQDLIRTMTDGKNVQYVNKKTPTFPELVKVLSHLCCNPDPDDINAFDAAVLLGRLCVADDNAKFKLQRALNQTSDTHLKAKALEILVKQLSVTSWEVVEHLLALFTESSVWRYRALAANLIIILGAEHVCRPGEEEKIYQILERKLWDDPTRDVRVSAAKALAALGMFSKACDRIEKRLEDTDEDVRAQAVISVGTLEMKNEKIIRLLLEMLELDSSEYVRLMIARTFTQLKMTDKRVMRALRERDKVEGPLARIVADALIYSTPQANRVDPDETAPTGAVSSESTLFANESNHVTMRESRKALKVLESFATQNRLSSPIGLKSMGSRGTPRVLMTPYTPAATA